MYDDLDALIRREIECSGLIGLAIALVRGGETVWSRGYGVVDLETNEAVTPQTRFAIQSVSKPVLATALMQWRDRGRFQLDDPVNQHLAPLVLRDERGAPSTATVRQLLTHTSGLPADLALPPEANVATSLEEFVGIVAQAERPVDADIVYANYGYDIIGLLLERFSGKSYDVCLREQLFEPLAMASTDIFRPGSIHARGYFRSAIDGEPHAAPEEPDRGWVRPCGALVSTVEDVARFLALHMSGGIFNGELLLRQETVAEMHRVHARHAGATSGMGLGLKVDESPRGDIIMHGGDGVGYMALLKACPERQAGLVLLMNTGRAHSARSVIGRAAMRLLLGEDESKLPAPPLAEAERLTGRYHTNFWGYIADLTTIDGAPQIEVVSGGLLAAADRPSTLSKAGDGRYLANEGFFDGFELAFSFGPDGRATSFAGGVYPFRFDRVGDVPPPDVIDEDADVTGGWRGTAESPLGSVPLTLAIVTDGATISALSAHDAPVEAFFSERGRVEGHFEVSLPSLGEFTVFLRLHAAGGMLRGSAIAQGAFGESSMPVELERAS